MKIPVLRSLFSLVVVGLLVCLALQVQARPAPGELLREAYLTLGRADHDYKGHRADAMKQIEAAGKLLGVNVRGDGKGHEKQGVSDEQLRTAQGLLEQAAPALSGKPRRHVERAIKQISTALRIR